MEKNTGQFNPVNLALSNTMVIPTTGVEIPFGYYETGKLKKSTWNPDEEGYDSLADYYVNKKEGLIEIRIPWSLLNFRDPSQKEIMGDLWGAGLEAFQLIESIEVSVGIGNNGKLSWTLPERENGTMEQGMLTYRWENWDMPEFRERLKESYYIFQEFFLKDDGELE
jgi:hypothetical protein